ncbi:MAG: polysaccharide deacetylase family protein [Oscillospiraceae bacterium]|nr:polysaccharide deacetylase family protein [Oscillospiraceae bacterium]
MQSDEIALPIVMYHQLTKSESRAGRYVLTLEQFEKDLVFLKEKGYKTVTVSQLLDYSQGKGKLPEKAIMITFDDGCETLYAYAKPLLEQYGFTAVGFVVGSLADYYTELDDHNLNYSNLNWAEIKELSMGNTVEIQSHSYDLHKNTGYRSGAKKKKGETFEQYAEFLGADASKMKTEMLKHTGKAPVAIAYPFGSFSSESKEILKKYGIKMAFTCEERVNIVKKAEPERLFGLGRYNRPSGISSESFFEKMGIN